MKMNRVFLGEIVWSSHPNCGMAPVLSTRWPLFPPLVNKMCGRNCVKTGDEKSNGRGRGPQPDTWHNGWEPRVPRPEIGPVQHPQRHRSNRCPRLLCVHSILTHLTRPFVTSAGRCYVIANTGSPAEVHTRLRGGPDHQRRSFPCRDLRGLSVNPRPYNSTGCGVVWLAPPTRRNPPLFSEQWSSFHKT